MSRGRSEGSELTATTLSPVRRFALNLGAFNLAQITTSALQFAFGIYLANAVGTTDYGRYASAVALVAFFSGLLDLGLELVVVRHVARSRERASELLGAITLARIFLAVAVGLLVLVTAVALHYPSDLIGLVALFYLSTAVNAVAGAATIVLQGLERFVKLGVYTALLAAATVLAAGLAVGVGAGLTGALIAYLGGALLTVAVLLPMAIRQSGGFLVPDRTGLAALFREAAPLGITTVISNAHLRVDRVMLATLVGAEAVGWYAAAFLLVQAGMDLVWSGFHKTFYPALSRLADRPEPLARFTRTLVAGFAAAFVGIAIGITFLADDIVSLLYRSGEYGPTADVLRILAWLMPPTIIWAVYRNILLVRSQNRQYAVLTASALGVNLAATFLLVRAIGLHGAAYAAITAQLALLVSTYAIAARGLGRLVPWSRLAGVAAAGLVLAGVLTLGSLTGLSFLFAGIGAACYLALLFPLRVLRRSDAGLFREVLA